MSFKVQCPICNQSLEVQNEMNGRKENCPKCNASFTVKIPLTLEAITKKKRKQAIIVSILTLTIIGITIWWFTTSTNRIIEEQLKECSYSYELISYKISTSGDALTIKLKYNSYQTAKLLYLKDKFGVFNLQKELCKDCKKEAKQEKLDKERRGTSTIFGDIDLEFRCEDCKKQDNFPQKIIL